MVFKHKYYDNFIEEEYNEIWDEMGDPGCSYWYEEHENEIRVFQQSELILSFKKTKFEKWFKKYAKQMGIPKKEW